MSLGVPLGLKQQKRALRLGRGAGPTALPEPLSLLFTPPQVFLRVPPKASPCKARLGCWSPTGKDGSTRHLLSGCWSCSLPFSSGLSNGHEDAYNEILLPASNSTLDPELRPRLVRGPWLCLPRLPVRRGLTFMWDLRLSLRAHRNGQSGHWWLFKPVWITMCRFQ